MADGRGGGGEDGGGRGGGGGVGGIHSYSQSPTVQLQSHLLSL